MFSIRLDAVPILLRHIMPLIGVFFFDWSPLQIVVALFLDSLTVLTRAAGVAAYFTTRSLAHDEQDLVDRANLITGGMVIFAIVLACMAFALGIFALIIWEYVLRPVDVQIWDLAGDRSLGLVFVTMLACQIPGFIQFLRAHDDQSARNIVEPEVGFVLQRVAAITILCGFVRILPGEVALGAALVIIQIVLAGSEIARRGQMAERQTTPLPINVRKSAKITKSRK